MWNRKTERKGTKLHGRAQEDLNESEEMLQDALEKQREVQEYRKVLSKATNKGGENTQADN